MLSKICHPANMGREYELTYTPPRPDRPPNDLGPFLYLLAIIFVGIYLLPALPVCFVYRWYYKDHFGESAKTLEQGSEES